MKIVLIPCLIILVPAVALFIVLRYLKKRRRNSVLLRIALALLFIAIGIMTTCYAVTISIDGMAEKGVSCVTGAVVFVPLGLSVNAVAGPLLLILSKAGKGRI